MKSLLLVLCVLLSYISLMGTEADTTVINDSIPADSIDSAVIKEQIRRADSLKKADMTKVQLEKQRIADSIQAVIHRADSINAAILADYNSKLEESEKLRLADSLKKKELEVQLQKLKTTDNIKKDELIKQLSDIEENNKRRIAEKKERINSLRDTAKGFPVIGELHDTLFFMYAKVGASTPSERALNISRKISLLYDDDFFKVDSLTVLPSENTMDIIYGDMIVMSVSENDAIWYATTMSALADSSLAKIKRSITTAKKENSLSKILTRIGLSAIVVTVTLFIIWLIGKGSKRLLFIIHSHRDTWLRDLTYKNYTFLSIKQEMRMVVFLLRIARWITYLLFLYITLPVIFSIFPFTRHWANLLLGLILSPIRGVISSVWAYLPNLFSMFVIIFVMKYVNQFVRYVFEEIQSENLKINGFHPDWAMPTYSIVKFLLYAFMFVLIFPYLPGSDSNIFKGVSVFIGILFSLGSSSAISNMVAGLVITYMRPFKIGDRIKIGDVSGDVMEKNMLVTRVRTTKNEVVTIPNSSVLNGNTTNYTHEAEGRGLIVHSTVTIGYDVPWPKMHSILIEAATRTDMVLESPKPFVLQTSLDDFYVSYQINAYTREASKQALIYSSLHQNIQDVCREEGIEIMSPHYRAERDGTAVTIPPEFRAEKNE